MPVYLYRCRSCEETFEVRHSMSEEHTECVKCGSESIFRVPSLSEIKPQSSLSYEDKRRPGKIVNDFIEETKQAVKKEKRELQKEEL